MYWSQLSNILGSGLERDAIWWHKFYPFNDFMLAKSFFHILAYPRVCDDGLWSCPRALFDYRAMPLGSPFWFVLVGVAGRDDWVNWLVWNNVTLYISILLFLCVHHLRLCWPAMHSVCSKNPQYPHTVGIRNRHWPLLSRNFSWGRLWPIRVQVSWGWRTESYVANRMECLQFLPTWLRAFSRSSVSLTRCA